jgi:hypothetical protein
VKKNSPYSFITSDFDCGYGFIGTAKASFRNIRGKPVNRPGLAECEKKISNEDEGYNRTCMQSVLLMIFNRDDPDFLSKLHPGLQDSYLGFQQWEKSLGHEPTMDDYIQLITVDSEKWLKKRKVTLTEDGWTEEVIRPGGKDAFGDEIIGVLVYYLGKNLNID